MQNANIFWRKVLLNLSCVFFLFLGCGYAHNFHLVVIFVARIVHARVEAFAGLVVVSSFFKFTQTSASYCSIGDRSAWLGTAYNTSYHLCQLLLHHIWLLVDIRISAELLLNEFATSWVQGLLVANFGAFQELAVLLLLHQLEFALVDRPVENKGAFLQVKSLHAQL